MENTRLTQLIDQSVKMQRYMFYGIAGFMFLGALVVAILFFTIPAETAEDEMAKNIIGIFGIVFVLTGGYMLRLGKQLREKFVDLVYNNPDKVVWVKPVQVRSKGIKANAIHLMTIDGKTVGLNIPLKSTVDEMISLLQKELPHATFGDEWGWNKKFRNDPKSFLKQNSK